MAQTSQVKKQPSHKRLLFFCLAGFATAIVLLYLLWCPTQCWRIRRLLAAAQTKEAATLSQSVAKAHPGCAECQYLDAKAARRSGDFLRAQESLQRAVELNWDPADIAREQVLAVVQTGRIAPLKRELAAIFASELDRSETEEVYEALANGHLAAFDGPELQQCLGFWIEWNPAAIRPRLMQAQFLERLGDHAGAAKQYESLLQAHPECQEARRSWGECLLILNQAAQAEVQLRICLEQQREPKTALLLAKCLVQTGQSAAAGTLLEEFKATPEPELRAEVLEELGRWHLDQNEAKQALPYLKESVALVPETATTWHVLSVAYSQLGQPEAAAQALQVSRETQARVQRLAEVIVELSSKPELLPPRIEAAQILFKQGLDQDAVAWLNTVLSRDLHHLEANTMLAEYYTREGNLEAAERHRKLGGIEPSPVE